MEFFNRLDQAIVGIYISKYYDPLDDVEKSVNFPFMFAH